MPAWTNEQIFKFIELYQNEPCIWNPRNKNHKDKTKVNDAWLRIADALGASVSEIKKKKETLMAAFRLNHKKVIASRQSCAGEVEIFKPIWIFYDALATFMSDVYVCKSMFTSEDHFCNNPATHVPSTQNTFNHNKNTEQLNRSTNRQYKVSNNIPQSEKSNPELSYVKRKMAEEASYLKTDDEKETDEYELYGQLLAKKLRKLDEHQRDIAMHEIDNIMFRAKMQSGNRSYSSSPSPGTRKTKSPIFIVAAQGLSQYEDENVSYEDHLESQTS